LNRRLGRAPSPAEIAGELTIPLEEVLEAMEAAAGYEASSIEASRASDDGDGQTFLETVGVDDERCELVEERAAIAPTLAALPARERAILAMRFVDDLTQQEIAERIGVSQMHVSRLIRRSLLRLRTVAEARA
jgi:RNA polymerase sigma-B factor